PYEYLRNVSSEAKNQILYNEKTFFKSIDNDDITFHWHYIESIFASIVINEPLKIQEKFSQLLMQQLGKLKKEFFANLNFSVLPFFFDYKQVGLKEEDLFVSTTGLAKIWNPNFNIVLFESKITSPFLKFAINYYNDFDSKSQLKKWNQYFQSLMLELYEFRNTLLHTGKVNEYSKIKLDFVLPLLINKVRWDLIYACKDNPNLDFKELIELSIKKINSLKL
ncbi:MAG: hypothetical protein M3Z01_00725, partial [Thermoproteota archaeon]|nr:hypothetical protein [Thermoproteota archaeon]